jgi:hypothetical protein
MKTPRIFSRLALLSIGLALWNLSVVDLRASDPLPPVPPGDASLPPEPAPTPATTPSTHIVYPKTNTSTGTPTANPNSPGQKKHPLEKLKNELGLTPEQVAKIKPIVQSTHAQIKAIRENTGLPPKQMHQEIRRIQATAFQQIRPILTAQQLQLWKQIREQHKAGQRS